MCMTIGTEISQKGGNFGPSLLSSSSSLLGQRNTQAHRHPALLSYARVKLISSSRLDLMDASTRANRSGLLLSTK